MNEAILFQRVTVVPGDGTPVRVADVAWLEGRWVFPGEGELVGAGVRVVSGEGKVLLPGLFDLEAHLREPGREDAETVGSGTEAAVNGGFTGLLVMPDTTPAVDNGGMVQSVVEMAARQSRIPVVVAGCLSKQRAGKELAEIGGMAERGAVMITDAGEAVHNPLLLRRALQYARDIGILVGTCGDVRELSAGGTMHEGGVSCSLGLPGLPACAEEIGIARDIRLAQSCGSRLHVLQVTTARGVETVRRHKREGVAVTAGVAVHHLLFTDADVGDYDTSFKVKPPLRPAADGEALLGGLVDGTLDVLVTAHAPRTAFEKECDFASAPFGMTGLETALPALHERFVASGRLSWETLVERFSAAPRRLLGLPVPVIAEGAVADAVLFDPGAETVVDREFLRSKSANTPFLGKRLRGRVAMVVLGGEKLLERL